MSDWQDSKTQLSTGSLTAFGISICTRHSVVTELAEMLNFCVAVAKAGLESHVESLFYDSNSCSCTFELKPHVERLDEIDLQLREIARDTIGQFEWHGTVEHGTPLAD